MSCSNQKDTTMVALLCLVQSSSLFNFLYRVGWSLRRYVLFKPAGHHYVWNHLEAVLLVLVSWSFVAAPTSVSSITDEAILSITIDPSISLIGTSVEPIFYAFGSSVCFTESKIIFVISGGGAKGSLKENYAHILFSLESLWTKVQFLHLIIGVPTQIPLKTTACAGILPHGIADASLMRMTHNSRSSRQVVHAPQPTHPVCISLWACGSPHH